MNNYLGIEIYTNRLILKIINQSYAEIFFKEYNMDIARYMIPKVPSSIEDIQWLIIDSLDKISKWTNIFLVVLDRFTKEFLWTTWLHNIDKEPELSIWIKKYKQWNWYGFEAVSWLVVWINKNLQYDYLKYPVDHRNQASIKIPQQLWWITDWVITKKTTANWHELGIVDYKIFKR